MARGGANLPDRPTSREIRRLRDLVRFVAPYRWRVAGGTIALLVTASTVLALGSGMRYLVDRGFGLGDPAILDQTVLALFAVTVVMAIATYARFYFVTWVGERVVADIRKAVFDHIVGLSPGFFEVTRTGEVLSRLTTDTTLLQTVIGSSASIACGFCRCGNGPRHHPESRTVGRLQIRAEVMGIYHRRWFYYQRHRGPGRNYHSAGGRRVHRAAL